MGSIQSQISPDIMKMCTQYDFGFYLYKTILKKNDNSDSLYNVVKHSTPGSLNENENYDIKKKTYQMCKIPNIVASSSTKP